MSVVIGRGGRRSILPAGAVNHEVITVGGGLQGYKGLDGRWTDYGLLWRTQPSIRTVTGFIARNVAQLSLKLYERTDADAQSEIYDDPLAALMRWPAPGTTAYSYMYSMVNDLAIFDRALAYKLVTQDGTPYLVRIPPTFYQVEGSLDEPIRFRFTNGGGQEWFMGPDEVVFLGGYSPDQFYTGVSPIETLRLVLEEERAAQKYRVGFYRNGARLEHVITRPVDAPPMDPVAKDRFWLRWNQQHNGPDNAGKTALLEEGMTLSPISATAKDAQYVEARRLSFEEVARQYYINPAMLGVTQQGGGGSYADRTAIHRELYQDSLGPLLEQIAQEHTRQLLPWRDKRRFAFDIRDKLEGSFTEQSSANVASCGGAYMTPNEVRATRGLKPIEGGDKLITAKEPPAPAGTSPTGALPTDEQAQQYPHDGSVADQG